MYHRVGKLTPHHVLLGGLQLLRNNRRQSLRLRSYSMGSGLSLHRPWSTLATIDRVVRPRNAAVGRNPGEILLSPAEWVGVSRRQERSQGGYGALAPNGCMINQSKHICKAP